MTSAALNLDLTASKTSDLLTQIILSILFFMWGVIVCLNNMLIPHFKNIFSLSYSQAMLVQFCFFSAYLMMSVPAGKLIRRWGYKKGIISGLLIAAFGCLSFYPSAAIQSYTMFLLSLFILATGVTFLQVSANPYMASLGSIHTVTTRLTIAQTCNSIGTTIAPFLGGYFLFSGLALPVKVTGSSPASLLPANKILLSEATIQVQNMQLVQTPYLIIASILVVFAVVISFLTLSSQKKKENEADTLTLTKGNSLWQRKHLKLGAFAIFFYVGAEVAIGSFLVAYLCQDNISAFNQEQASAYVAFYWGGALVGRLLGSFTIRYFSARYILTLNAVMAAILVLLSMISSGYLAMVAILLVGFFNSIMFPTIFSLALHDLGEDTVKGSSILCLSIVGGAIIPSLQGMLADITSIQSAFVLPALCYLYIAFYGIKGANTIPHK
jgi:FHS family L-fucose permease-like MFS transporter